MKKLDLSLRETVVLVFFLVSCVFLFTTIYLHWEFISDDPLKYGLEQHKYSGCVCYKEGGYTCFQLDEGFKCKKNNLKVEDVATGNIILP